MDRKTFLAATPAVPLAAIASRTPARDSVTFLLNVGDRTTEYSFYIDEHTTNLMGMFRAICVAAEGEFVSRVVLPRGVTPHV